MTVSRRSLLATAVAALALPGAARAQSEGQWHALAGDDGKPVANTRLPGELTSEIETLKGVTWIGPRAAAVTLYEFFDYNCPWCRAAAKDVTALAKAEADLRIGLVNNPILSPQSAQAAKVALAVQRRAGSATGFAFYGKLLGQPGRIDGPRALDTAAALGLDRAGIEAEADSDEVQEAMKRQMTLAADLGLHATPSYVVGTSGILGHPGRRTLAAALAAYRDCGEIVCGPGRQG